MFHTCIYQVVMEEQVKCHTPFFWSTQERVHAMTSPHKIFQPASKPLRDGCHINLGKKFLRGWYIHRYPQHGIIITCYMVSLLFCLTHNSFRAVWTDFNTSSCCHEDREWLVFWPANRFTKSGGNHDSPIVIDKNSHLLAYYACNSLGGEPFVDRLMTFFSVSAQ